MSERLKDLNGWCRIASQLGLIPKGGNGIVVSQVRLYPSYQRLCFIELASRLKDLSFIGKQVWFIRPNLQRVVGHTACRDKIARFKAVFHGPPARCEIPWIQ